MPATTYKIWAVGAPVGKGAANSFHVGIAGIAKGNSAGMPYIVANERICGTLAKYLLLPIPPCFLIDHDNRPHFVSLNFNLAGQDLPPAEPAALVAAQPNLAGRIIAFDVWVVNTDRGTPNLAFDASTDKAQIFDHSHAFYQGKAQLTAQENELGIGGHCLAPHLNSLAGVRDCLGRMESLPDWQIRECVESAAEMGLPADDVDFCVGFLLNRRRRVFDLMRANRATFPNVPNEEWN